MSARSDRFAYPKKTDYVWLKIHLLFGPSFSRTVLETYCNWMRPNVQFQTQKINCHI